VSYRLLMWCHDGIMAACRLQCIGLFGPPGHRGPLELLPACVLGCLRLRNPLHSPRIRVKQRHQKLNLTVRKSDLDGLAQSDAAD
jgi:hypothetical protein